MIAEAVFSSASSTMKYQVYLQSQFPISNFQKPFLYHTSFQETPRNEELKHRHLNFTFLLNIFLPFYILEASKAIASKFDHTLVVENPE